MRDLALIWRDWMPLATATLGLFIGAVITELHVALAGARERRRALNVLLFDLLQLRFDVRSSNPRTITDVLLRVVQKKLFGNDVINVAQRREMQAIIVSIHREIMQTDRFKLAERFESALRSVIPYEPILAYQLSGNERLGGLERAIALYYQKVAQRPDVAADPKAPQLLGVMEEQTTAFLIDEVLKGLASDIIRVARARVWWPLRRVWMPLTVWRSLRRQDGASTLKAERELEVLIDGFLPSVVDALQAASIVGQPRENRA